MLHPRKMILIGAVLVILGAVLPFLMMIRVLPSTFLLNGFSFIASMGGLFLGMLGMTMQFGSQRRRDNDYYDF